MRSLLFLTALGLGMAFSVATYVAFGSSLMVTAGLLSVIALFGVLCLSIERSRDIHSEDGGIE